MKQVIIDGILTEVPEPSEIAQAKANNIDNTRGALLERLEEGPPSEITITFNHVSFVIRPETFKLRKIYTDVIKAIADTMQHEIDHHIDTSKIELEKEVKVQKSIENGS